MKKKILAFATTVALAIAMVPAAAFAHVPGSYDECDTIYTAVHVKSAVYDRGGFVVDDLDDHIEGFPVLNGSTARFLFGDFDEDYVSACISRARELATSPEDEPTVTALESLTEQHLFVSEAREMEYVSLDGGASEEIDTLGSDGYRYTLYQECLVGTCYLDDGYKVTCAPTKNGTVTATAASAGGYQLKSLKAVAADHECGGYSEPIEPTNSTPAGTEIAITNGTFTMPYADAQIVAEFEPVPAPDFDKPATPTKGNAPKCGDVLPVAVFALLVAGADCLALRRRFQ